MSLPRTLSVVGECSFKSAWSSDGSSDREPFYLDSYRKYLPPYKRRSSEKSVSESKSPDHINSLKTHIKAKRSLMSFGSSEADRDPFHLERFRKFLRLPKKRGDSVNSADSTGNTTHMQLASPEAPGPNGVARMRSNDNDSASSVYSDFCGGLPRDHGETSTIEQCSTSTTRSLGYHERYERTKNWAHRAEQNTIHRNRINGNSERAIAQSSPAVGDESPVQIDSPYTGYSTPYRDRDIHYEARPNNGTSADESWEEVFMSDNCSSPFASGPDDEFSTRDPVPSLRDGTFGSKLQPEAKSIEEPVRTAKDARTF
ncbi:hypothetical protein BX600DRAFT_233788 [Xylariales sp. PMI_506]|nr:hypothetical protein BX600DRAFT_233788 [Xylariales sp. PMI_506]